MGSDRFPGPGKGEAEPSRLEKKTAAEAEMEACEGCGRPYPPTALEARGADGWLCPYCRQENDSCGCEDGAE